MAALAAHVVAMNTGYRDEILEPYDDPQCCGQCDNPEVPHEPCAKGDPGWLMAHGALLELHRDKSSTYGTGADPLANFTAVAAITGDPPELYVALRMIEKLSRAVNQIRAGSPLDVAEWPDLAGLALCGEALRIRTG